MRTVEPATLQKLVGSWAESLRRLSFGDDPRSVNPNQERKSIGCEETYAKDLADIATIRAEVHALALHGRRILERKRLFAKTVDSEAPLRGLYDDHPQRIRSTGDALARRDRRPRREGLLGEDGRRSAPCGCSVCRSMASREKRPPPPRPSTSSTSPSNNWGSGLKSSALSTAKLRRIQT